DHSISAPENRWSGFRQSRYALGMNTRATRTTLVSGGTLPPIAEMQRAYLARDAAYNGVFFLGVRTTGIFCRPTWPARKPAPRNVEYFATPKAALIAGYRPCKRCRPLELDEQPSWASALLAEVERDPAARISDGDLAARGVDPATARRYFQRQYGMTFQ